MPNMLGVLLFIAQMSPGSIPAVDVTAAEIRNTLETTPEIAPGIIDTPIRTLDAGDYDVGIAVVSRGPATGVVAGTTHTEVTEVYTILEGSGTIVTGGRLIDPRPRGSGDAPRRPGTSGPSLTGTGMEGAVSRELVAGDMVIIPAGTPHYFAEIPQSLVYTIVRIDPGGR